MRGFKKGQLSVGIACANQRGYTVGHQPVDAFSLAYSFPDFGAAHVEQFGFCNSDVFRQLLSVDVTATAGIDHYPMVVQDVVSMIPAVEVLPVVATY